MQELSIIEYQNVRVATTKQIAQAYGTSNNNINKAFNRNKDKYKEGKHYFKLSGEEKNEFIDKGQNVLCPKNVKVLYLWTERGALLLAKSINTDVAWEAYERLVDFYFDKKEEVSQVPQIQKNYNVSLTPVPKQKDWFTRNYRRINRVKMLTGMSTKAIYHKILGVLASEYDLDEANKIYERENGEKPPYAMSIVSYFPELGNMAEDFLIYILENMENN